MDVTNTIRKTAKVIPPTKAVNFVLSVTSSLKASLRIPFTGYIPPLGHAGTQRDARPVVFETCVQQAR
jgi:hypothetical protein